MFKRFFKQADEKPAIADFPAETAHVLSERIGKVVKRPERPVERATSRLSEPVALPREPLKGIKTATVAPAAASDTLRPNDRRSRDRDLADKAPPVGLIYLTRQAFHSENPVDVVQLNTNIVSHFLFEIGYRVEELQQEGFRLYSVEYYLSQATRGGHALFAKQAHGLFPTWRGVREGLEAMEAREHLDIYQAFTAYLKEDDERAERIRAGSGFGKVDPGIKAFDEQIRLLETISPLIPRAAEWLKARPAVQLFEPEALEAAIKALAAHPVLEDRRSRL